MNIQTMWYNTIGQGLAPFIPSIADINFFSQTLSNDVLCVLCRQWLICCDCWMTNGRALMYILLYTKFLGLNFNTYRNNYYLLDNLVWYFKDPIFVPPLKTNCNRITQKLDVHICFHFIDIYFSCSIIDINIIIYGTS